MGSDRERCMVLMGRGSVCWRWAKSVMKCFCGGTWALFSRSLVAKEDSRRRWGDKGETGE